MRTIIALFAAVSGVTAFAGGAHNEPVGWFHETYTNITINTKDYAPKVVINTDAGRWLKSTSNDYSTVTTEGVTVATRDEPLSFSPRTSKGWDYSTPKSLVKVTTRVAFASCEDGDEYWVTNSSPHAAIALRSKGEGNDPVFIGWHTMRGAFGYWTELANENVAPKDGEFYDVTVETDHACSPIRVRYSVNGYVLHDSCGQEWFVTSQTRTQTTAVDFWGFGQVGEMIATQETPRTERATLKFGNFTAKAGAQVDVSSATLETNGTAQIVGELNYAWYLTDASGLRTETAFATGAACTLGSDAYGHWVTVEATDDNGYVGSGKFWCSELPVAYIDVENGAWPSSKKEDHDATMFLSTGTDGKAEYDGDITIHVRGNSTAGAEKKPYKIKLDKKTNLFKLGADKNKHWVLLANYFDESLMRNKITYDLSEAFGLEYVMHSTWIDVVMNGQFQGCYQLCEHIRVGEDRINIADWAKAGEKVAEAALEANPAITNDLFDADTALGEIEDLLETNCQWMTSSKFVYQGTNYTIKAKGDPGVKDGKVTVVWKKWKEENYNITGGYIFELDSKKTTGDETSASSVPSYYEFTNRVANGRLLVCLAMNTPEYAFTNPDMKDYCSNLWWQISNCALSGNGYDGDTHYTDLIKISSLAGYWLSQYVPANLSILSRYSYQDVNKKMHFGPAWDYDYALGSLQVDASITVDEQGQKHYAHSVSPRAWGGMTGSDREVLGSWTFDPYFSYRVRTLYWEAREAIENVIKDGGLIDQYRAKLATSAAANDLRWNNRIGFADKAYEKGDVTVLKEFFTAHVAWMDEQFATVAKTVDSATGTVPNTALRYARKGSMRIVFAGEKADPATVETQISDVVVPADHGVYAATVTGLGTATKLRVELNGLLLTETDITDGTANFSIESSQLEHGEKSFLSLTARDANDKVVAREVSLMLPKCQGMMLLVK